MTITHNIIPALEPLLFPVTDLILDPNNARIHTTESVAQLERSLKAYGQRKPIVVHRKTRVVLAGNGTLQAALSLGWSHVAVVRVNDDPSTATGFALADNRVAELSEWDAINITILMENVKDPTAIPGVTDDWLRDMAEEAQGDTGHAERRALIMSQLRDGFPIPPVSVLDARQGEWGKRKRLWRGLGIEAEAGRDAPVYSPNLHYGTPVTKDVPVTSLFDPVLAEAMFRWFCPRGGSVLDPFAGESVKGLVAGLLGYRYTGVELRPEQVAANMDQAKAMGGWGIVNQEEGKQYEVTPVYEHGGVQVKQDGLHDGADIRPLEDQDVSVSPEWRCGDSTKIEDILPEGAMFDFSFTSPPYYNLEEYKGGAADGSMAQTYDEFMEFYRQVFAGTVARLKDGGFLAIKVGILRTPRGDYYDFVSDTIKTMMDLGLHFHNEFVLLTSLTTAALRTRQFEVNRKVVKTHQNVLVFYKGDPANLGVDSGEG